jgi:glucan 1,3-beta-glucosidase
MLTHRPSYYQPNPPAPSPFPAVSSLNDPLISSTCAGQAGTCAAAWGLRVLGASSNILVYGAGLYSFFNNYANTCSDQGNGEACQNNILSIETAAGAGPLSIYNLNTVGVTNMVTLNGVPYASYAANLDGFVDTIALWRS